MPDFERYYERMMSKRSRGNMFYCWLDYKSERPNGYQTSQFYEYFSESCKVSGNPPYRKAERKNLYFSGSNQ